MCANHLRKKAHVHSTYLLNCETDYKYIKCVLLLYTRISHSHLAMSSRAPFASTWIVEEESLLLPTPSTAPLQCANLSFHTTNACVAYHFVSALYCRGSSLVRAMNKRVPWRCDIYTTETQTYAGTSVSWVAPVCGVQRSIACLIENKFKRQNNRSKVEAMILARRWPDWCYSIYIGSSRADFMHQIKMNVSTNMLHLTILHWHWHVEWENSLSTRIDVIQLQRLN